MRKPLSLSAGIVLLAAGFAVASIATSGSLAAIKHTWTTLSRPMSTTTIVTTTGPSNGHGRGIVICFRFHRGHHRYGLRSRIVDFRSLRFFLRHGSHLGPCIVVGRHHGDDGDNGGFNRSGGGTVTTVTVTTTVGTTTTSNFVGRGPTGPSGQGGDGDGGGRSWNSFTPNFGHGHHHH